MFQCTYGADLVAVIGNDLLDILRQTFIEIFSPVVIQQQISQIATASVLHDVGKIAIPDYVLNKPGKLTPEEFKLMQQHPVKGCELLNRIPNFHNDPLYAYSYDICRWHHERWDGRGYSDGLAGEEIPLCARIMAVADVFDAVAERRCYKPAMPMDECFDIIRQGKGTSFDPRIVEVFLENRAQVERVHETFTVGVSAVFISG